MKWKLGEILASMFTFLRQIFFSLYFPSPSLMDSKNARVWSGSRRIPCARRILATRHHRDFTILESPRLKRAMTRSNPAKSIRSRRWKFVIRDAWRWIIVYATRSSRDSLEKSRNSLVFDFQISWYIALTMVLNIKEILRKRMLKFIW